VIDKIKHRLASEQGFTLIELLVVIVILGILVAIAVPAYLSFRGNAQTAAAESNVRSAVPAAEDYYETNGSYTGMTTTALQALVPGVSPHITVTVKSDGTAYCIADTTDSPGNTYHYNGGTGGASTVASGDCDTL
jgi:type IV pilus assembly protein PilA